MHLPRPRLVPSPAALCCLQTGTSVRLPPPGPGLGDTDSAACHPGGGFWAPSGRATLSQVGVAAQPVLSVPDSAQVLRSLNKTYQNLKRKPVAVDLDPKAVTCDELFGIINPATREWKDGT